MNTDLTKNLLTPENILRKQFPNGVTVLLHENPWSKTAAICGSLFAGCCLESPEKIGLSAFTAAALPSGTPFRSGTQISEYLESIGGAIDFCSGPHTINFKGKCLSEDLPEL